MKIGFDAKRAFVNNTGLGQYSRNLLRSLQEFHPDHEYFLYTPHHHQREDLSFLAGRKNIQVVSPAAWYEKAAPSFWRSFLTPRKFKQAGLDVYHGLSNELPAGLKSSSIKKVVTIHDLIFLRYPSHYSFIDRSIYEFKFKHACETSDVIIAVSQQTKNDLVEFFGTSPEKVRVVYQSANPEYRLPLDSDRKEAIRHKYGLPRSYILSVGSIIERKNLLRVVQALKVLKNSLDPFLVVVGKGGTYEQRVRKFVVEKGLKDRVLFLGSVPQSDLVALQQMAEVFVYPSIFEGFGIPIIEALLSGVPVITSKGSCFPESGGPGSIYVDPFNIEELAEAIKRVLGDASLRDRMIGEGKEFVKRFDPSVLSRQMMETYQG